MNNQLSGWWICLFFILGCSYSLFKRLKSICPKIKLPVKNLLNYHCVFSVIATILAFIHAGNNLTHIRFSNGYISLILMILVTLIGILMKYFKKIYVRHKMFWLYTHIFLTIMLIGSISLHIFRYLLL
ncbi:hypothetical protein BS101_09230 [Clostridium kluyveri]|uniref:DUF4405 domain-containing protein n=1 Tax=Clostridium kluyveri TaxID=1534 RepID=A0A1L5F7C3_CLOKL|nr:hypothetical protein BS101_09230 [Clostridium kluyveri]